MAPLRRRLVVPTVLVASLIGSTTAFFSCEAAGDDPLRPGDAATTLASDGGATDTAGGDNGDGDNGDATTLDAAPMPDSPPDARPDAPVG